MLWSKTKIELSRHLQALSVHDIERLVGAVSGLLRAGPASQSPYAEKVLVRLGVLAQEPARWEDSSRLSRLPWGPMAAIEAPPASPPPGFDGSWPQAPLYEPRFAPPVLHIENSERMRHIRNNVTRYLGQLILRSPSAAWRAKKGPRLVAIDDHELSRIISETSFAQLIHHTLNRQDHESFAADINAAELGLYAKLDFSSMDKFGATLPGVYVAPTVSLLKRVSDTAYVPIATRVGDQVIRPEAGPAWELARYFVLQGAQMHLPLHRHPRLHFPGDTINAITRTLLPQGHMLHRLLWPHLQYTQGLHEAVIHHRRSVMHNSQREWFTPAPFTTEAVHNAVALGLTGIPGKEYYSAYRFDCQDPDTRTLYGKFQSDWYGAYYEFVTDILSSCPKNDQLIRSWGEAIAGWIPGFPNPDQLMQNDTLIRAVTGYICAVSVYHTADHHSYATIPCERIPWRIRVPPPNQIKPVGLNLDELVQPEDFFRALLFHEMFKKPTVIQSLSGLQYGFRNPQAVAAELRLAKRMAEIDARWKGSTFPSSREISSSLQY